MFVIPIAAELDLKKAAKSVGEKSVEMLHVKDITAGDRLLCVEAVRQSEGRSNFRL